MAEDRELRHVASLKTWLSEGKIDRREFLRSTVLLGVAVPTAYAWAGLAPRPAAAQEALPRGGTVKAGGLVLEISTPHAINSQRNQANLLRPVLQHLTRLNHDNVTEPFLLESWEPSEDLKTWTLRVRQGVKWHNGRDFTAEDVVWNLKRIFDAATGSSALGLFTAFILENYQENGEQRTRLWDANAVELVDSHTVRLNGQVPVLAIPENLSHYGCWMMDPEEGGAFGVGSNGTGPFEMVEHEINSRAAYAARQDYWGDGPYIDRYEVLHIGEDPQAPLAALAARQVDGLWESSPDLAAAFQSLPHVGIHSAPTATAILAGAKVTRPPFDNPLVRRALRLATDNQAVVDVALNGYGVAGEHHHVAKIHPEYAALPPVTTDVAAARALLAEAGYPDGVDVEITAPQAPSYVPLVIQTLVEQWKEAGIRCAIKMVPNAVYGEIWDKEPFIYAGWDHRPLGIMMFGIAYRTGSNNNNCEYSNPELDALVTEAEGLVDPAARSVVMAKIEALMQEDGPISQPAFQNVMSVWDNKVLGFRMHPQFAVWPEMLAVQA